MTLKRQSMQPDARAHEPRLAACRACAQLFPQRNSMHRACSPRCALKLVRDDKREAVATARAERLATRASLEAIKPRAKWVAEAQAAFNAFIRVRDQHLPCISCGRFHAGKHDAGHYLTTGARPELRFDERNCWRQCVPCNRHLHGNLVLYRAELVKRIGLAEVELLEGPHPPAKWSIDDLRAIRDSYRIKSRQLAAKS